MGFNSVTITPTLDTAAYADGDVLFVGTELQMPHRACKLLGVQAVWDDAQAANENVGLYFFAQNTNALGTINAAANITAAQIAENGFLGYTNIGHDDSVENHLGTPTILVSGGYQGTVSTIRTANPPITLVAGAGTSSSPSSIFVQAILEHTDTGITTAADALKITFHFEY